MKLSARTQYGVRIMYQLAMNYSKSHIQLGEIASSENLSEKFLSLIVVPLKAAGLIASVRGTQGGYLLSRAPEKITMLQIFEALEIQTLEFEQEPVQSGCASDAQCASREFWRRLSGVMEDFLAAMTLDEFVKIELRRAGIYDYVI